MKHHYQAITLARNALMMLLTEKQYYHIDSRLDERGCLEDAIKMLDEDIIPEERRHAQESFDDFEAETHLIKLPTEEELERLNR